MNAANSTEAPKAVTLRELIAGNVRKLRAEAHVTQDDVVKAAVHFGLSWTRQWMQALERGNKALTAEQLLALPLVLSQALGHRVGLADLLDGDIHLNLGKADDLDSQVSSMYLRDVVTAPVFKRPFENMPERPVSAPVGGIPTAAEAAAQKVRILARHNLGNVDIRALQKAEAGAGETEAKLAKKLGVAEIVVLAAAASLWGHSLSEQRDVKLDPGDGSPKPGPMSVASRTLTTKLMAEVAERIAKAERDIEMDRAKTLLRQVMAHPTAMLPTVPPSGELPIISERHRSERGSHGEFGDSVGDPDYEHPMTRAEREAKIPAQRGGRHHYVKERNRPRQQPEPAFAENGEYDEYYEYDDYAEYEEYPASRRLDQGRLEPEQRLEPEGSF